LARATCSRLGTTRSSCGGRRLEAITVMAPSRGLGRVVVVGNARHLDQFGVAVSPLEPNALAAAGRGANRLVAVDGRLAVGSP